MVLTQKLIPMNVYITLGKTEDYWTGQQLNENNNGVTPGKRKEDNDKEQKLGKTRLQFLKWETHLKPPCKLRQFPNKFYFPKLIQEAVEKLSRLRSIKVISVLKSTLGAERRLETQKKRQRKISSPDARQF